MAKLLQRTGLELARLDQLSVIHVAGTKGKGSTCSMCESILRRHGFRTGLFTGPHLVHPRERIRLDGRPMPEDKFAASVQKIYSSLLRDEENETSLPSFFSFMTAVAFHVFLKEQVDVAIVEVGCGGIDDATNVLRNVSVVGITSLGLDHTQVLGETLAEIAAVKAGILKRSCCAYTAPQPSDAMDVLVTRGRELDCPLSVVPELSWHRFPAGSAPRLPADVPSYRQNAALALQLTAAWLRERLERHMPRLECHMPRLERHMPREAADGLTHFRWPGRYHIVDEHYAKFYLDGAHTKESMEICVQWFTDHSDSSPDNILMYTCTPEKNVEDQFNYLMKIPFKEVYFVPHNIYEGSLSYNEQLDYMRMHRHYRQLWRNSGSAADVVEFQCVDEALNSIKKLKHKPSVLVTGSIYLIGSVLSIIDPKSISM